MTTTANWLTSAGTTALGWVTSEVAADRLATSVLVQRWSRAARVACLAALTGGEAASVAWISDIGLLVELTIVPARRLAR